MVFLPPNKIWVLISGLCRLSHCYVKKQKALKIGVFFKNVSAAHSFTWCASF